MKHFNFLFVVLLLEIIIISSCRQNKRTQGADNETINGPILTYSSPLYTKEEGVLKVLIDNSLTSYFIFKGQAMGFEYEMLELFAKENNLTLELNIIYNVENILDSLIAGKGDLVAANLTISGERMKKVAFSDPLFRTQQILVQRLPDDIENLTRDQIENGLIRDRLDLNKKSVMIRKNSSYELMLQNLISETGLALNIEYSSGDVVTEQLMEMVSLKEIDYTICDQNKAQIFNAYFDNLDIKTPMSLSQPIAWAINKGSTELQEKLNIWIEKRAGSLEFNMINNKYFELNKRKEKLISSEYDYIKDGKISDYDDLIKKYATTLNWDWRLLTAQIYKESKFDPKTTSWRGAVGLMQLMPRTVKVYGLHAKQLTDPEKNIEGGTKHLKMLEKHWSDVISDSLEIVKFTLGSYNVGQGHVEDAMRLAEKYDLNKSVWDGNVAQMLLNKSIPKYYKDPVVKYGYCRGKEPVNYVVSIFNNYELYRQFTNGSSSNLN